MTDDFERDPVAEALRRSLAAHAADAPPADLLAERIIHTAERGPAAGNGRSPRGWRTWALPVIAAGAVGAVVAAVIGIENFHTSASNLPGSGLSSVPQTALPTPVSSTPPPSAGGTTTAAPPPPTGDLTNVRIADLTFVGDDDGWALGSADCLGGPGRCTAMWRTTDGTHWQSMAGVQFNVPGVENCADPCVTNIRFANDNIGYAYGPSAFYVTSDGGKTWDKQPGGAIALETLDNNVIRVTADPPSGCPGPCNVQVQTADVGSTRWTAATLGRTQGFGVQLARGGHDAYLLDLGHPAGGGIGTSVLYRSTDDGRNWEPMGEPCPQTADEIDSVAVAAGGDQRVTVLCMSRSGSPRYVATSVDAGQHFAAQSGVIPRSAWGGLIAGDPQTVLVVAGTGLTRSTDGGATWQQVADVTGEIGWVGFESPTVGRAVSADGTTIWTTRDGGGSWRPAVLG